MSCCPVTIGLCGVLFWGLSLAAAGQELLQPGLSGRPLTVMDEAENWSVPISVYSDQDTEMFIPDVTRPGWVQWHAAEYRRDGTYTVSLFSFYKTNRFCRQNMIAAGHGTDPKWLEACAELRYQRSLLKIDTRKRTVTVLDSLLMERDARFHPLNQTFPNATLPLSKALPATAFLRIERIVRQVIGAYNGMTAEDVLEHNRRVQLDLLKKMMTPDHPQGCPNATAEQMTNWHNVGCPPAAK